MELDATGVGTKVATRLTLGCADPHGIGDADASFSDSVPRRRASFNINRMQPATRDEMLRRPLPQINIPHVTLPRPILRAILYRRVATGAARSHGSKSRGTACSASPLRPCVP